MNMTDRIVDLSVIWKHTSQVFPWFDRNEIHWDNVYREYISKVMESKTNLEFQFLLAEFINLLGDGHTDYVFPRAMRDETGYLPFALRFVQDTYCIGSIIPEYLSFSGAQVFSVNDTPLSDLIREVSRYGYHVGAFVPRLNYFLPFLLKRNGNIMKTSLGSFSFDLCPSAPETLVPQVLKLPDHYLQLDTGKLDIRQYEDGILYVRLDDFMYSGAVNEVQSAIKQIPEITGIIFDLRENIGGMTMYGAKIAELLIPGEFHGCQKRTRSMTGIDLAGASQIIQWSEDSIEKHIAAGYSTREEIEKSKSFVTNTHYDKYIDTYGSEKHTALFSGPCVILTSRYTVSAAEDFVAMFRTNKRATIVGTETCGTTGTPLTQQLQCGGWLRVCSVGYQLLDGTEFIGCGIKPDVSCEASAEDLRRGHDSVLDKGLSFLRNQLMHQQGETVNGLLQNRIP